MIDAFAHVVDAWLRAELLLMGTVIPERLVEQYGFTGNYKRVTLYLQQARSRIVAELGISPDQRPGCSGPRLASVVRSDTRWSRVREP